MKERKALTKANIAYSTSSLIVRNKIWKLPNELGKNEPKKNYQHSKGKTEKIETKIEGNVETEMDEAMNTLLERD